jgi:WD40 repeat protein
MCLRNLIFKLNSIFCGCSANVYFLNICLCLSFTVFTIAEHNDRVHAASFSPDGNKLVSCGEDRTFKVFDLTSGMQVYAKMLDEQLRYI